MKNVVRVIAWNVGLLLVLVLVLELVFGGWLEAVDQPNLWRLSIYRDIDWRLSVADRYPHDGPVRYRRDHWGLRGDYGRPQDVDILAVGGSTTDERYVDDSKTWIAGAQDCLAQAGQPVKIANGGVSGQSSRGHIRNFELWYPHLPGLRPRLVLVYLGINETVLDGRQAEDDVQQYNESGRSQWIERLKLKSALYTLVTAVRGNLAAWRAGLHSTRLQTEGGQLAADAVDRAWAAVGHRQVAADGADYARQLAAALARRQGEVDAYAARLRALVAAIRAFGAEPVLATQVGGTYRRDGKLIRGDLDQYFDLAAINATTLAVCRETGATCLDLAAHLEFGDGDFYDSVHTTAQGSAKVAAAMCRALLATGLARTADKP
ncbi:MAG: hypothetical protein HQL42_02685 [Alphaproteobacteria bacterium]|nr:hypothetical protein [Alphaproteobacteria bacterium]